MITDFEFLKYYQIQLDIEKGDDMTYDVSTRFIAATSNPNPNPNLGFLIASPFSLIRESVWYFSTY